MVEVKIAEDGMTAEVLISPEPDEELTVQLVEDTLRMEGVHAGISKKTIAKILEKKLYQQSIPVAAGKDAVNGQDGYYEFFFATDDNNGRPKIREDGSVDYHFQIVNVNEGDLLAEYHPETAGTFGFNVFSHMLPPARGKAKRPLSCMNVRMEENKYYAAQNGSVTLSGNHLSIHNVLEVSGDTTYDNGDISFNGDIHVAGNICNGITVQASGSVFVDGVIENARVYAGLDVVVSQGICGQGTHAPGTNKDGQHPQEDQEDQGHQGQIEASTIVEARGKLKSKFIDHAYVRAAGDIIMDYAIGSVIVSEGKVTANGAKGAIIGGSTTALFGVDAGTLGNSAELYTEIKVGEEQNSVQSAPVIVRKSLHPNVHLYFGKMAAPEVSGRSHAEYRRVGERILCKKIGTFQASEHDSGTEEKEMQTADQKRQTILVIDDDAVQLRMVHGMLKKDYQVAAAAGGSVARKYLENHSVDLILLDYMMPEENGAEVLKSLRANEATKDIPVVFLTGLEDKQKIMECLSLHPAGYILKPVKQESLLMRIRAILGKKSGVTAEDNERGKTDEK